MGRTSSSTPATSGVRCARAAAPRNSRELAVRNQFFTPRYVVDFLVQNTLGRRLIENDPPARCSTSCRSSSTRQRAPGPVLQLDQVKCLDPACGSGHFLLGCYDLLERAWELAGVAPSESAPTIVAVALGCRHRRALRPGRQRRDRAPGPPPLPGSAAAKAEYRHRARPSRRLRFPPARTAAQCRRAATWSTESARCSPTPRCWVPS